MTEEGKAEAGEVIRVARIRSGLSLGTAAELLGLSRQLLGDIEHGRERVTPEALREYLGRLDNARNTGNA